MKPGILVISHGSREPGWVSLVDETVDAARVALGEIGYEGVPVEAAFLELVEGRLIQDGVDTLERAGVTKLFALPLFVSSGSTHVDEIGWALGAYESCRTETDLSPISVRASLTYGQPMNEDEEIVDVLLERLAELSAGVPERKRESVFFIAHGSDVPGFHEAWRRGMASIAAAVCDRGGYADAETAMLRTGEVATRWELLRRRRPSDRILAVPLFLSEGYFTSTVIPRQLEKLDCRYEGKALMPHRRVTDWIVRQAAEWLGTSTS